MEVEWVIFSVAFIPELHSIITDGCGSITHTMVGLASNSRDKPNSEAVGSLDFAG